MIRNAWFNLGATFSITLGLNNNSKSFYPPSQFRMRNDRLTSEYCSTKKKTQKPIISYTQRFKHWSFISSLKFISLQLRTLGSKVNRNIKFSYTKKKNTNLQIPSARAHTTHTHTHTHTHISAIVFVPWQSIEERNVGTVASLPGWGWNCSLRNENKQNWGGPVPKFTTWAQCTRPFGKMLSKC